MNAAQFPFLLKLLDDESVVVQGEIQRAMVALAPELPALLNQHEVSWPDRLRIHHLLAGWRKGRLLSGWVQFYAESDRYRALEQAHRSLSHYSSYLLESQDLSERLDSLAENFNSSPEAGGDPQGLSTFLFSKRFQGDARSYYSPDNSFLSRVLSNARGNPISLCSLFVLVGRRLGFKLWGCNFPGHFLALEAPANLDEPLRIYDCFGDPQVMGNELTRELRGQLTPAQVEVICRTPVTVQQIVLRMIRNLVGAYLNQERRAEANLFFLLLKDLAAREKGLGQGLALREPLFQPGQLVSHKAKGYRGVIVDYELYVSDATGPSHEAIYRVLVHGSPQVASARESTLRLDQSGSLVAHPFVTYFFSKFEDGVYFRNAKPWEK